MGNYQLEVLKYKTQPEHRLAIFFLALAVAAGEVYGRMKSYTKILFSVLAAVICATAFAADQPACKKSGKNCPMNNGKACNCGKHCDC
ncbi:MAG: hypothetical protein DME75_01410 [Verrucomicrobia bacterium]|nr:MAG: hypothetical protein DME75_01410 [Verrucomicrobiota bacterium]